MLAREVRILLRKELRQLVSNRAAMLTGLIAPVLMIFLVPMAQITGKPRPLFFPPEMSLPAGLHVLRDDPLVVMKLMLTPLLAIAGLMTPTLTASYIFLSEREARTLELLVALPVRVSHILLAKLGAVLVLAVPTCVGLFAVDAGFLLGRGRGSPGYVLALLVMLLAALAFSCSAALLVSLLARDIRTSSNLNGVLLAPFILGSIAVMVLIPGVTLATGVLAAAFMLGTVATLLFTLKVITFERLLR